MSATEQQERQAPEGLSSVKLVRNAKGDTQIEVKVYAASNEAADLQFAQAEAERIFDAECLKYRIGGAS